MSEKTKEVLLLANMNNFNLLKLLKSATKQ